MLMFGMMMIMLSSFNLKTMKEVKEMYRISMMLLLQIMVMLYDSMELDFMNKGMSMYNDMLMMTSYTKIMELMMLMMTMLYMYVMKEYMMSTNNVSTKNMQSGLHKLLMVLLINMLGMMLFMQWNNSMVMFMTLELQSYTMYIMCTLFTKSYNSTKSGLLYFLLGSVGSMMVLFGLTLLYSEMGLLNMNDMSNMYNNGSLAYLSYGSSYNNMMLGYMFMMMGLLFKMGTWPFHNWLINMYANTPTMMTMWMSMMTKISMLTVLYTMMSNSSNALLGYVSQTFNNGDGSLSIINSMPLLLGMMSLFSMMFGAFGGLGQFTIKRMMGYSGLVNSGYFMFMMLSNNNSTLSTYMFNMYQYSLTHMVWFMLMLVNGLYYSNNKMLNKLYNKNGSTKWMKTTMNLSYVKDLYGYLFMNPYVGFCYMIVLSSLIGMPPLTGFYAKYYMLLTGMNSSYLFLSMMVLLSSSLTAYYYLFMIKNLMMTDNNGSEVNSIINMWKSVKLTSNNTSTGGAHVAQMTPMLSMLMSTIIMMIIGMTMGLDMANNGTHMVESYYMDGAQYV
uniref:NADH-ubiquinone oxidoreductase chain 2 n=1 Tax=Geotrichum candidum TaxID=1173061 RepID=A0A0A1I5R2_GEOCN|nr:NADH dehydrogenase subunit 2 [Geotrichum candidum]CDI44087.1 NADH dehydrogenase subunit 2 [Geotrichum candidum]